MSSYLKKDRTVVIPEHLCKRLLGVWEGKQYDDPDSEEWTPRIDTFDVSLPAILVMLLEFIDSKSMKLPCGSDDFPDLTYDPDLPIAVREAFKWAIKRKLEENMETPDPEESAEPEVREEALVVPIR